VKRREFITLLGGAAVAWPLAARIAAAHGTRGWLPQRRSASPFAPFLAAFRQGLRESGYIENENLAIAYRWAEGQSERLPGLAAFHDPLRFHLHS